MEHYQAVKGMRDLFPDETVQWSHVEQLVASVATLYGFQEIRLPFLEYTDLFQRSIGSATDIVGKEMYSFAPDPSSRSLTLRPEMTAGVMRAVLQKKTHASGTVNRYYYIGELFRKEKPQAGRQRQFSQFGAELLGISSPVAVAEVITMMMHIFERLGLTGLTLKLNSLGSIEERERYRQALRSYFVPFLPRLDEASRERLEQNPLRILDSKDPVVREIVAGAPLLHDCLGEASHADFREVQAWLTERGINYVVDHHLVRGLDYYGHTAFEVVSNELGAQDALGGGGRYDALAATIDSSVMLPAVGFAVGMERLLIAMTRQGLLETVRSPAPQAFVVVQDQAFSHHAHQLAAFLRKAGLMTAIALDNRSMKAQMREANRSGATVAVIVGAAECETGRYSVKNLRTSSQSSLNREELLAAFSARSSTQTELSGGKKLPCLRIYGKTGCCLCTDLQALLDQLGQRYAFDLEIIDITTDPALETKYGQVIPLLFINQEMLFSGRIDEHRLREVLEACYSSES